MLRERTDRAWCSRFLRPGQETERVYSYNPGARGYLCTHKDYLIITSLLLVSASARCSHTSPLSPGDCTVLTLRNALVSINNVAVRWTQLLVRWVTASWGKQSYSVACPSLITSLGLPPSEWQYIVCRTLCNFTLII